jgi:hypothetical protein
MNKRTKGATLASAVAAGFLAIVALAQEATSIESSARPDGEVRRR